MSAGIDSEGADTELVQALQGWQIEKERASSANRDLLQYAAGITAVLGIVAGSGGIFAVATAVTPTDGAQLFSIDLLKLLMAVGFLLAVVLGIMLLGAFRKRRRSERAMEDYLRRLIALRPDAFLPKLD